MFGRIRLCLVVVAIFVAHGLSASPAAAQVFGAGAYGLGFFNYSTYDSYYRVPYYSLYPPVYYSYPVARPYGYSPFAYPPGTITPEIQQKTAAVEYRNPFVPQRTKANQDKSASAPRMYYNPFVTQSATASTLAARPDGT